MKFSRTLLFGFALVILSCGESKKYDYKPESIGGINTVAVVVEDHLWEGTVGDKIREHFAAPVTGLIWEEPKFSLRQMPQYVFSGTVRKNRAVLYVAIDTVNLAHIKKDLYAQPQLVGVVKGKTSADIIEGLDAKADDMINAFKDMEVKVSQKMFRRSLSKETALKERLNINLEVPSVYKVGKQDENFVWMDRQIPKGHMNIFAYSMPASSFSTDSTFVADIVRMRDSIGEKYVPGPEMPGKTTYMITERSFSPHVYPVELAGLKGVEVRGLWEIMNYPMAGPFVTYILNDKKNNRKLVIEGLTFAPATEKRDYMFELESILKTVKIY
jgi:hypothetical protein